MRSIVLSSFVVIVILGLTNCDRDELLPCEEDKIITSLDSISFSHFPYDGGERLKYRITKNTDVFEVDYVISDPDRYWDTMFQTSGAPESRQNCDSFITEHYEMKAINEATTERFDVWLDFDDFAFGGYSHDLRRYHATKNGTEYSSHEFLDSFEHNGIMFYDVLKVDIDNEQGKHLSYWNDQVGIIYRESRNSSSVDILNLLDFEI